MKNYIYTTLLFTLFISISLVAGPDNDQQSSGWKSWLPASWGNAGMQQTREEIDAALHEIKKQVQKEKVLKVLKDKSENDELEMRTRQLRAAESAARDTLATVGLAYIYSTLNQCQPQTRSLKRSKFLTGYFALYCALQAGNNVLVFKAAHEQIKQIQTLEKHIEEAQKAEIK